MNKKVMAIAVAGALAVPSAVALAQTSTVQVGGSITAFYYSHKPENSLTGQRTDILEQSEPNLWFRGEEKLGGGLSVWFKCESSMDAMIAGAGSAAGWCARNSGIGFKGSFGNLFLGNWDQPQKLVFNRGRQWWGGTNSLTGGSARLLDGGSASGLTNPTLGTGQNTFFRRQARSWNYHSPSWNGFQVQAGFSSGTEGTGIPEANTLSPRMWSLAGHYTSGPLYISAGYEQHQDYNPGAVAAPGTVGSAYSGGDDTNWTLVAGYRFGAFNIRGLYSRSEYDVTNTTNMKVDGWALWADWAIQGPHTLRFQYASVDDTEGNSLTTVGIYRPTAAATCGPTSATSCASSTGGKLWSFAYSYAFSKRTEGSFVYTKMDNDLGGVHTFGKVTATAGNSQTGMGIVLKHRF